MISCYYHCTQAVKDTQQNKTWGEMNVQLLNAKCFFFMLLIGKINVQDAVVMYAVKKYRTDHLQTHDDDMCT